MGSHGSPPPAVGDLGDEARLPSGDPLSTRTRPGEGTWDPSEDRVEIHLWDDEDDSLVLIQDSDLRR